MPARHKCRFVLPGAKRLKYLCQVSPLHCPKGAPLAKAAYMTHSAQSRNYDPLSLSKADGFPSPPLLIAAQDQ